MVIKKVLITGSCGLVGSESVKFFTQIGFDVYGIDNDNRGVWFGKNGSVFEITKELKKIHNYNHFNLNIINKNQIKKIIKKIKPDLILHCAAQPSHDKSAIIPYEDFVVNAVGTMNILESIREFCPKSIMIYVSTNKVYGDKPNEIIMKESISRFWYDEEKYKNGIDETMSIDQSLHSPFGSSKASADLMVQEYGKYYGIHTACFRCGCITGLNHQGVELHGYLNYLCKTIKKGELYTIYGHKGKQVRDNIHAQDLVLAFWEFIKNPKIGEVYNIGGGIDNSCSIIDVISKIEKIIKTKSKIAYAEARKGDHICYYTNFNKFKSHYPNWKITKDVDAIIKEILAI